MTSILYGWPWAALVLGASGLLFLLVGPRAPSAPARLGDPAWIACLMLPLYMVHQFEEHGVDFLGRHYHFLEEICGVVGTGLHDCPADPGFILAVNCGGGCGSRASSRSRSVAAVRSSARARSASRR